MLEQNTEQNENETWWQPEQPKPAQPKMKTTDFQENLVTLDYIPEDCLDWDDEYLWELQDAYNEQTERLEKLMAAIIATPDSTFRKGKRGHKHKITSSIISKNLGYGLFEDEAKVKEEQAYQDFLKNEYQQ